MDGQGRCLLLLLLTEIKRMEPGRPETYITYKEVHDKLGLCLMGPTYGMSLRHQGLDSLANWINENSLPAITGVIVSQDNRVPGDGFVAPQGHNFYEWWKEQIRQAKVFDWSEYVAAL